jgi:hypothetical protein
MNTAAAATQTPNTATLRQEWEMFQALVTRLLDVILNRVFALTIKGSRQRRAVLALLFLLVVAVLYLATQGLAQWLNSLQVFFSALLTGQPSIQEAVKALLKLVLDARILRLIPVFLLPFLFSREFASRYLADIFELDEDGDELKIARKFISEVSLGGADNKLTVSVDNFDTDKTKESPIRRIGGPGRVTVELGTAILVERPDGCPRIIGPVPSKLDEEQENLPSNQLKNQIYRKNDQWHYKYKPRTLLPSARNKPGTRRDKTILEGFDRIREPIDLRVQMPEALEVNARSRDGIPIKVIDARVVFSIARGIRTATLKEPYPYTDEAILAMVYEKPNRVTNKTSTFEQKSSSLWDTQTTTMKSLLRKELADFMGRHELGEYLASIGEPESEAIKKIEQDISTEKQKISGLETHPSKSLSSTSPRRPRSELSRLFSDFNGEFNQEQKKRGVEAQWVGVGTWKMPPGIPEKVIPQKHLTAWQITLENMRRGSEQELSELELNAQAEGIQRLILQAPISTFRDTQDPGTNINRARINLITAYWQQLNEEVENRERTGEPIPPSIVAACFKLLLKISHIPYPDIPAPASPREKKVYAELLKRVKIPQAIEKLIDLERRFFPNASRAELLERIIKAWDADVK